MLGGRDNNADVCGENEAIKALREACVCEPRQTENVGMREEWHAHYYRQKKSKIQQINGERKKRRGGKWDERGSDGRVETTNSDNKERRRSKKEQENRERERERERERGWLDH